mgnify:CR=1 FL=1
MEKKLYSIISYVYGLLLLIILGILLLLINFLRIKFVSYIGINLIPIWISYSFYIPLVLLINLNYKNFKKYKEKFKRIIFSSSFLTKLHKNADKPNIDNYGITESELNKFLKRNQIDTKFYSEIASACIIIYFVFSSFNDVKNIEFFKLTMCLIIVYIIKKLIDCIQLSIDKKWKKYNLLNRYIKDLGFYNDSSLNKKTKGNNVSYEKH